VRGSHVLDAVPERMPSGEEVVDTVGAG
jgi:hypothetical protein